MAFNVEVAHRATKCRLVNRTENGRGIHQIWLSPSKITFHTLHLHDKLVNVWIKDEDEKRVDN